MREARLKICVCRSKAVTVECTLNHLFDCRGAATVVLVCPPVSHPVNNLIDISLRLSTEQHLSYEQIQTAALLQECLLIRDLMFLLSVTCMFLTVICVLADVLSVLSFCLSFCLFCTSCTSDI